MGRADDQRNGPFRAALRSFVWTSSTPSGLFDTVLLLVCRYYVNAGADVAGLREILKVHGASAGMLEGPHDAQMHSNQMWLSDMAVRLICVLALDRFGDFNADQVNKRCASSLEVLGCGSRA